jgi:hypothetical protein
MEPFDGEVFETDLLIVPGNGMVANVVPEGTTGYAIIRPVFWPPAGALLPAAHARRQAR